MRMSTEWLVGAAFVLAVPVLCSCAYTPPKTIANMSVQEARRTIGDLTKPPVILVAQYLPPGVFSSCQLVTLEDHYQVYIRRSGIRIIGKNKHDFPFKSLDPQQIGQTVSLIQTHGFFCSGEENPDILLSGLDDVSGRRLADAFNVLKNASPQTVEDEELAFREVVRSYRSRATNPDIPEAARRFKVQAEGAVHDKDYDAAADLYGQAIGVAPWWPEGHFNRALVLSETAEFSDAITEMKRYLELVPDAPDARAAQDKIYEWERKVRS
jgi:tetratricopeptide (TPR) repeat protein